MAFTVVYDACVLHPASVRDLLIRLAQTRLFRARWTNAILEEMIRSVIDQSGADLDAMRRTADLMCEAVPDCLVTGYEHLIAGIVLPDPDDRHVVAAAVRAGAEVIVTNNLADFPEAVLDQYGLEAQSADEFVLNLIDLAPVRVGQVVHEQAAALRDPPLTVADVLGYLERAGLAQSVAALRAIGD